MRAERNGRRLAAAVALLTFACSDPARDDAAGPTAGSGGADASAGRAGMAASGAEGEVPGSGGSLGSAGSTEPGAADCLAGRFLSSVGQSALLIGAAMADETARAAPFTLRYLYLAGGFSDGDAACADCASGCSAAGQSCANDVGCGWWGCWQWDQDPPGAYVRDFVAKARADGQLPMISYYEVLQASGVAEGQPEVSAVSEPAFMRRFWAQWRFLLEQIGESPAVLHVEPDFWGYAEQLDEDPARIPAAVASAGNAACADQPDTLVGMGRCLVAMTRAQAPNARIALHASGWATRVDVIRNTDPGLDVAAEGAKVGRFLAHAAPGADLIVADIDDRDAAYWEAQGRQTWLDDTNQTLPSFHQLFAWGRAVAESAQLPLLWWQVPVGNMSLPNTNQRWRDNCVDYLMAHTDEVAAAHGVGIAFGAGNGETTTPETDGGHLVQAVTAYALAPEPPCP